MKDEKLDNILKAYFTAKIDLPERGSACPAPEALAQYASGSLSGNEGYAIGSHVKGCRLCAELIEGALLHSSYGKDIKLKDVPLKIKEKAKLLNPAYAGKEHKLISLFKKNIWFTLCLSSFIASFFVPRYFLQFLALAIILGLKWVFNKETTRTLIMVYNAWKKHDKASDRDLEEIFKGRF